MPDLSGFHHVKLPVSDLDRSRAWYTTVLGLHVEIEFVEEGVVKGLALAAGGIRLALRHDPPRAAALAGFDPIALAVPTRDAVQAWRHRLDELGQAHGGVVTGHRGGAVLVGLHDPDGIEIRLYADETA
ncbi:VOC family protein [Dactylosporangium aurantiacum]|uniref:VOC family protein n=1 Tax=Dactylosporangium aurantiacum TaxID=35754 RepID=A0A9Q9IT52_9ACTN|nr:VOC family protein [Dactylosporangium aurantiacum]MDG6103870.1 VOC family protein [Dactylosporangium aurantiacum]UWZ58935.1 VOC family protein [Dactylosporangium aurantiacum]